MCIIVLSSVLKTIISSVSMICLIFSGNNKLAAKLMGLNKKLAESEMTSELTSDTESSDHTKKRKKTQEKQEETQEKEEER